MKKAVKLLGFVIFLTIALFFVIRGGAVTVPKDDKKGESNLEIFADKNGSPALATGSCSSDSECRASGCSSQICSNHEVVTTCELGVFPEKETYSCGCKNDRCVWYRYR